MNILNSTRFILMTPVRQNRRTTPPKLGFHPVAAMRDAIKRYNRSVGTIDTPTNGSHETITRFYMRIAANFQAGWRGPERLRRSGQRILRSVRRYHRPSVTRAGTRSITVALTVAVGESRSAPPTTTKSPGSMPLVISM